MSEIRFHCVALLEVMKDTLGHLNFNKMFKLLYDIYLSPECFEFILSQFYTSTFRPAYKDILNELGISSIYQVHDKKLILDILRNVASKIITQRKKEIMKHSEYV